MKKIFAICGLLLLGLGPVSLAKAADVYAIDNAHTSAMFRVSHLGYSHTWGRFQDVSGSFKVDTQDPAKSTVEIVIKSESLNTNDEKRDKHLRGPDFFNTKQHPTLTFKSTAVKKLSDSEYEVAGDLTINGVTKGMTLQMKKLGEGKDPWGKYRMGFETQFTLKRSDFKINYMPDAIGDEVTIYFSSEGIKG